jgi:pseudouridine-5'-phosphate glycosidase
MDTLPASFFIQDEVKRALRLNQPVVALESTVITHGLPPPHNLALARDLEAAARDEGAIPATVAVLDGVIRVGLTDAELVKVASTPSAMKISRRDFAAAIAKKASGGTTVAGTMFAAHKVGIKVFATGGIGGIHRESHYDISPDLQALAETPMIIVCAGAKAILNLAATLEYLETVGVPVIGYRTNNFPAFFSRESGLPTSIQLDTPEDIVEFAETHWQLGMRSAILVAQPVPINDAILATEIEPIIQKASQEAQQLKISGQELTPFLLERIDKATNSKSLRTNISLLLNNSHLASRISKCYYKRNLKANKPKFI